MPRKKSDLCNMSRLCRRARANRAKESEEQKLIRIEKRRIHSAFIRSQETDEARQKRLTTQAQRTRLRRQQIESTLRLQRMKETLERLPLYTHRKRCYNKSKSLEIDISYQVQFPTPSIDTITDTPMVSPRGRVSKKVAVSRKHVTSNSQYYYELHKVPAMPHWAHVNIKPEWTDGCQWVDGTLMGTAERAIDIFNVSSSMNGMPDCDTHDSGYDTALPDIEIKYEPLEYTEDINEAAPIEIKQEPLYSDREEPYTATDGSTQLTSQYNLETNNSVVNINKVTNNSETNVDSIEHANKEIAHTLHHSETDIDIRDINKGIEIQYNPETIINGVENYNNEVTEIINPETNTDGIENYNEVLETIEYHSETNSSMEQYINAVTDALQYSTDKNINGVQNINTPTEIIETIPYKSENNSIIHYNIVQRTLQCIPKTCVTIQHIKPCQRMDGTAGACSEIVQIDGTRSKKDVDNLVKLNKYLSIDKTAIDPLNIMIIRDKRKKCRK